MDGRRDEHEGSAGWLREAWRSIVPVGLAAGLALVIAGGMDVIHRQLQEEDEPRSAAPAADARRTAPRFVVGVAADGSALTVRNAADGAEAGLPVAPPQGRRFTRVASGPDGAYIVASAADGEVAFQRLRLDDAGRPAELAALPEAVVPGDSADWSDLAVAPGGDRLAYVTYEGTRGRVDVLTLATGARKTWTSSRNGRIDSLSWSGDTLSFVWEPAGGGRTQVRTIDTRGAAGDLAGSEAVLDLPSGADAALLRPDGATIVTGIVQDGRLAVQEYSAATGELGQILWTRPVKGQGAVTGLDADENGTLLVTAGDLYTRDGRPLPGKDLADAAW